MTVTAIQIGLDPDVIDYSSPDFARFPGLSREKLRATEVAMMLSARIAGSIGDIRLAWPCLLFDPT